MEFSPLDYGGREFGFLGKTRNNEKNYYNFDRPGCLGCLCDNRFLRELFHAW